MVLLMTRLAAALALFTTAMAIPRFSGRADAQSSLTLDPKVIQNIKPGATTNGQTASLLSKNNFINFCITQKGFVLTNGTQAINGSCNPTPIGRIPSKQNMPHGKFVFPTNFSNIPANQNFTLAMKLINVKTGNFVNPNTNYFAGPQVLDGNGHIIGHSHLTVESLPDGFDQKTPTDPTKFTFFKGVNSPADENDVLSVPVVGGLPVGHYRACSINAGRNHQSVIVPVLEHGSLDDCVYFQASTSTSGSSGSSGNNGGSSGGKNDDKAKTYTVKAGDICNSIAKSQGITLSKLFSLNKNINSGCTNLEIGEKLKLQ